MKIIFFLVSLVVVIGCTTIPNKLGNTESVNRVVASRDNVFVTLYKDLPTAYKGMTLQQWQASVFNHNNYPVCVLIEWKLMDFKLTSKYSGFVLLGTNSSILQFARMTQQVWNLGSIEFAPPPSGYLYRFEVREPIYPIVQGQECSFK